MNITKNESRRNQISGAAGRTFDIFPVFNSTNSTYDEKRYRFDPFFFISTNDEN